MFAMLNRIFSAIEQFFVMWENFAKAGVHISTTAELHAKFFADEAVLENAERLELIKIRMAETRKANGQQQQVIEAN